MPSELSGGMQKRVGLARAIVLEPEIVVYDEPTTGLDPLTSDTISELIRRLQRERQITSIVVTHDVRCAFLVADRIAMLDEGTDPGRGTARGDQERASSPSCGHFSMAECENEPRILLMAKETERRRETITGIFVLVALAAAMFMVDPARRAAAHLREALPDQRRLRHGERAARRRAGVRRRRQRRLGRAPALRARRHLPADRRRARRAAKPKPIGLVGKVEVVMNVEERFHDQIRSRLDRDHRVGGSAGRQVDRDLGRQHRAAGGRRGLDLCAARTR